MEKKLEVGDIILVHNPIWKEPQEYPVTQITGNKAFTRFRTFNTKIYNGRTVYEFGKRLHPVYNNYYEVKKLQ